ncbi:hypothetical protein L2E82_32201 [Cichorium intybus]|uniref:Uncharacterized protein n=1 Tax=Cichorium intybus TaxID=13427 RepID=A0ACB9BJ02_CICIN|nr:hypothetical protein L2E82_32201 [Cichorium intybus]
MASIYHVWKITIKKINLRMKRHYRHLLHPSQPLLPFSPSIIEGSDPNRPEVAHCRRFSLQQCFLLPNHNLEQLILNPIFSLHSCLSLSTLTETRYECYDLEGVIKGFSDRLAGTSVITMIPLSMHLPDYEDPQQPNDTRPI